MIIRYSLRGKPTDICGAEEILGKAKVLRPDFAGQSQWFLSLELEISWPGARDEAPSIENIPRATATNALRREPLDYCIQYMNVLEHNILCPVHPMSLWPLYSSVNLHRWSMENPVPEYFYRQTLHMQIKYPAFQGRITSVLKMSLGSTFISLLDISTQVLARLLISVHVILFSTPHLHFTAS